MENKKYELTDEHRAQLKGWSQKWIDNAFRATPLTPAEWDDVDDAVRGLYSSAKLEEPIVVHAASPISAAIASGVAAGIWHLRENDLFGTAGEDVLMASAREAVRICCVAGQNQLRYGHPAPRANAAPPVDLGAAIVAMDKPHNDTMLATNQTVDDGSRVSTFFNVNGKVFEQTYEATHLASQEATDRAVDAGANPAAAVSGQDWRALNSTVMRAVTAACRSSVRQLVDTEVTINTDEKTRGGPRDIVQHFNDNVSDVVVDAFSAATSSTRDVLDGADKALSGEALAKSAPGLVYTVITGVEQRVTDVIRRVNVGSTIAIKASMVAAEQSVREIVAVATAGNMYDALEEVGGAKHEVYSATAQLSDVDTRVHEREMLVGAEHNDEIVKFFIRCAQYAYNMRTGGNQWSGWVAYLSFFRYIAKLDIDYTAWDYYERAAKAGPRYLHNKFCIVSDLPTALHKDEENRPHCATGPQTAWADGWEIGYWRGTAVPLTWITEKDKLDPKIALTWDNIEQRRCAAEIIGWDKILEYVDAYKVDEDKDPEIGTLYVADLPDAPGSKFLKVKCGTGRSFVLPVPSDMKTALEANAWTWSLQPEEYRPEFRT